MIFSSNRGLGAGVDYEALWDRAKKAGQELYNELPGQVAKKAADVVTQKATNVVQPAVQQVAQQRTSAIVSAGSVAAFTAAGAVLGALIAGGSWQRRAVGGTAVGIMGAVAGLKLGWARTS